VSQIWLFLFLVIKTIIKITKLNIIKTAVAPINSTLWTSNRIVYFVLTEMWERFSYYGMRQWYIYINGDDPEGAGLDGQVRKH
jgi:hypothetical protein